MLQFSHEDLTLLHEILTEERNRLMTEVNRTDALEYKHMLRDRRQQLDRILVQLNHAVAEV